MRITVFASGSTGNCALVEAGGERLLIDAGISLRRISGFLAAEGLSPADIACVLITHEHADHGSGLPMLTKKYGTRVVAPRTVAARLRGMLPAVADYIDVIRTLEPFAVGGAEVTAFHTLHDTDESVGYRIEADGASFGLCTDLGCLTDEVLDAMCGVEAAVIESNYDEQMLCDGPYPVYLKRRILSDHGHLSNEDAGRLAVRLAESGARGLNLGHLSREYNRPDKALAAVSAALAEAGESPELLAAPPLGAVYMEAGARCRA